MSITVPIVAYNLFTTVELLSARLNRLAGPAVVGKHPITTQRTIAQRIAVDRTVDDSSLSRQIDRSMSPRSGTDAGAQTVAPKAAVVDAANPNMVAESEVDSGNRLMARLQAGDDRALASLLPLYNGRLYAFLLRIVRDAETAEDIVQETWLSVYESRDRYRTDHRFSTWLFTIARRKALSELRRRKVRALVRPQRRSGESEERDLLEVPQQTFRQPDVAASGAIMAPLIEQALDRLSDPQREIILLRDVEGLDNEEVAEVLGWKIKPGAVRKRIFDARAAFRRAIHAVGLDGPGEC